MRKIGSRITQEIKNINVTFLHEMNEEFFEYQNLPFRGKIREEMDGWYGRSITGSKCPYAIASNVIKKFLNKSFDNAFSYYCQKVSKRFQKVFYQYIDVIKDSPYNFWRLKDYYVDDFKNIQRYPRIKKPRRDSTSWWGANMRPIYYYEGLEQWTEIVDLCYNKPARGFGRRLAAEQVKVEILTYDRRFEEGSKDHASAWAAELQARHLNHKVYLREQKEKVYDLLTYKRKKKADALDDAIRDRHGFNKDSFKGSEYHGGQRKRNKKKNKSK